MKRKATLFYRDGSNYKCTWEAEIDISQIEVSEGETFESEYLDPTCTSDPLLEIENLGLSVYDIPLVKEYGYGEDDHNYISIVKFLDVEGLKNVG